MHLLAILTLPTNNSRRKNEATNSKLAVKAAKTLKNCQVQQTLIGTSILSSVFAWLLVLPVNMFVFFSAQILLLKLCQHLHDKYLSLRRKLGAKAEISSQLVKHSVDVLKLNLKYCSRLSRDSSFKVTSWYSLLQRNLATNRICDLLKQNNSWQTCATNKLEEKHSEVDGEAWLWTPKSRLPCQAQASRLYYPFYHLASHTVNTLEDSGTKRQQSWTHEISILSIREHLRTI